VELRIEGVGVTIDARSIISDVDLVVAAGQLTALVGPNGSGKSTLLRTVYRALRPTTGVVRIGGDDAWRLRARDAARRRAVVTQHHGAGEDFTVAEVVAMGRGPHLGLFDRESARDRDLVDDAIARVDLAWAAERMFGTLSGGERQRALLARALAQQAPLVILDEPTNHLDVRAQLDLLALVGDLGVTLLAALHDLDQAAGYADRVAVLDSGRLVAAGHPDDVLTPDLIERVFGVQAHIAPHPLTGRPHICVAARAGSSTRHTGTATTEAP
jgi:iron complex transport system ATP-binding protein